MAAAALRNVALQKISNRETIEKDNGEDFMPIVSTKPSSAGSSSGGDSLVDKYGSDSTECLAHLSYTIVGNAGDGKTLTALKLSKYWGVSKYLLDAVLVCYDHNAPNCLAQYGTKVDIINVAKIMTTEGMTDVRQFEKQILFPMLQEYRLHKDKTLFIFDSISARCKKHLLAIDSGLAENAAGQKNKLDLWTRATGETANFATDVLQIPDVTKVFISHSQVKEGQEMGSEEAKRIAAMKKEHSDPTKAKIGLDLPGKIGDPFVNEVDVCLFVKTRVDPKAKTKEYFTILAPGLGYRTKTKFEAFLGDGEHPADLGAVERTIRAGIEKAYAEPETKKDGE